VERKPVQNAFSNRATSPTYRPMNPLLQVRQLGQQIWLDNLSRTLLNDGHLARFVADDGVAGVTTNPAIFHKAIAGGRYYEDDLAALKRQPLSAEARYEALVIPDVQRACALLAPLHRESGGNAGYVSLEVSPALAHDAEGTVAAGLRLKAAVDRPNLLIKVPATAAGLIAIERLVGAGVSVNVTLMFSLAHVDAVAAAYMRGLEQLRASGGNVGAMMSVASLFLSRIDTLVDKQLDEIGGDALALRGKSAVATAKLAYRRYLERFHGPAFAALRAAGARPQFMLWASTGTKNPAYSDLLYVEPLIGAETVNTLPDATLAALRDHGRVSRTLDNDVAAADGQYAALATVGVNLDEVGDRLQQEGLAQFEQAFAALLELTA
jgi:transaldolase